jgi:RHS repeat-associated protein
VYDGWNLIGTLNSQLSTLNSFVWGLDLSGSFQGAGGIGGLLWVNDPSTLNSQPSTHLVSYDGNGNVVALVNAADGSESARYVYGPFGEVIRATGPMAKANPFRFSTKYQDDETDLLYYGRRYYSASTGRWISRDPIEERGGADMYCFIQNGPQTGVDPNGLQIYDPCGDLLQAANEAFDEFYKEIKGLEQRDTTDFPATISVMMLCVIAGQPVRPLKDTAR